MSSIRSIFSYDIIITKKCRNQILNNNRKNTVMFLKQNDHRNTAFLPVLGRFSRVPEIRHPPTVARGVVTLVPDTPFSLLLPASLSPPASMASGGSEEAERLCDFRTQQAKKLATCQNKQDPWRGCWQLWVNWASSGPGEGVGMDCVFHTRCGASSANCWRS